MRVTQKLQNRKACGPPRHASQYRNINSGHVCLASGDGCNPAHKNMANTERKFIREKTHYLGAVIQKSPYTEKFRKTNCVFSSLRKISKNTDTDESIWTKGRSSNIVLEKNTRRGALLL